MGKIRNGFGGNEGVLGSLTPVFLTPPAILVQHHKVLGRTTVIKRGLTRSVKQKLLFDPEEHTVCFSLFNSNTLAWHHRTPAG